jgi:hypothetical protein
MSIRNDNRTEIDFYGRVNGLTAKQIRDLLLDTWKMESPSTLYRYFVETLQTGKRVYLERPGQLNKGCDFVIFVEDLIFFSNGNDKPPRHKDLLADLRSKANSNRPEFLRLRSLIQDVYNCNPITPVISQANALTFNAGWSCEVILKVVRWFFIEQDLTYWNRTGRAMLWTEIQTI